jgi:transposase-like protein
MENRELPERWSAQRKSEIVVRLLRGEDLGELSREIQVPPPVIEEWRVGFLS